MLKWKKSRTNLTKKIAELEKKDAEIQQIESSSQAVSEKFKNIEAQCEEQMTKLKNIEDERDALSAQNAELSQKLASNEDSLTVVNVADDTAKDTRISQLEEEISKLNEQVDQAKTKNEAAEAKIAELEKQSEETAEIIEDTPVEETPVEDAPADENTDKTPESDENKHIKALEQSQREIEIHVAKLAQMEASSVPKTEFEKIQDENSKLKGILTQTEEMLVELQSSVRKEEDSFVKKIRDLETRLEEYECNAAGDSSAQTGEGSSV